MQSPFGQRLVVKSSDWHSCTARGGLDAAARKGFALVLLWFVAANSAQAQAPGSLTLSIEEQASGHFRLSFPTVAGKKYQLFQSGNLTDWTPLGDPLAGTGQTLAAEYAAGAARLGFFRVQAQTAVVPVPLRITTGAGHTLQLRVPTHLGKQYLAFASLDLKHWFEIEGLFQGTGQEILLNVSPGDAREVYFRGEELEIRPMEKMVRLDAGSFVMGSPTHEKDRDLDEDPLTQVFFSRGLWIGQFEVTQGEYELLMGANPSWFKGNPDRPVESVSWKEALAYCTRLTERERALGRLPAGWAYRLPTEAEFEFAARGGSTNRFHYGNDPEYTQLGQYAWYDANSGKVTHPVGLKKANQFGLHDIMGNVWEWCMDYYGNRYPGGAVTDPEGPASGGSRVFRGGGVDYVAASCRPAFRNHVIPARRLKELGFRVVLAPE